MATQAQRRAMTPRRRLKEEWNLPDFGPGGIRGRLYVEADLTVWKGKAPYVKAIVRLEHVPNALGRQAVYVMEGRIASPWRQTANGQSNPPLGSTQLVVGAKALEDLKAQVREALSSTGWRQTHAGGVMGDWWQAPEGPALDEAAARRSDRRLLHGKVAAALDAVLDGDGMGAAEFRDVPAGGGFWTVWAEPAAGGVRLQVAPQATGAADPPTVRWDPEQATWHKDPTACLTCGHPKGGHPTPWSCGVEDCTCGEYVPAGAEASDSTKPGGERDE